METKICIFEENEITFNLSKDNGMMINATDMAKIYGKKIENFTRTDQTQDFIKSCMKIVNSEENKTPKSVFYGVKTEEDLIISIQKSGTFMHRILALKFAAWLNPDFEVWVFSTIERLLFGKLAEREKSLEKTVSLQNEMNALRDKQAKTGADFDRYLEIQSELSREKSIRQSLTKESLSGMADMFREIEE